MKRLYILFLLIFLFTACATHKPHYVQGYNKTQAPTIAPEYTVFFFGGADHGPGGSNKILQSLYLQSLATDSSALILLGNNRVKKSLAGSTGANKRKKAEENLDLKLSLLNDFKGDVFMIPGNHDWANGSGKGYENLLRLEEYVGNFLERETKVVVPGRGCPGPYEVEVSEGFVYIFLYTQWWFHQAEKPTCGMESPLDFVIQLEDAVKRNLNKKLVVVGHHPVLSNGPHGGYFPWYIHLSPPLLGSLYAWYRKNLGGLQDLAESRYRMFTTGMKKILEQHPNVIYLSGHERSLQYHKIHQQHYIVSGAIAKATATVESKNARFAYGEPGFGRLNFYKNGDVYLEFWTAEELVYREKLYHHTYDPSLDENHYEDIDYTGQAVTARVTGDLAKKPGKTKPGLLGNNYRQEWGTKIKDVPVFDLGKEKGGLEIIKKGGGMQTRSLRLQAKDGKQYTLRSVEKFPENAVPAALRGTVVSSLVSDQISASHPYGALAIPKLAEAAGVHHTNPKLVYLPADPRLGRYREDFSEGLYLFEERPAGEHWQDHKAFGQPQDIKSTFDLVDHLQKKDKDFVDEAQVLRSRLFDILIGDWDRHDDQWRFAEFKAKKNELGKLPANIRKKVEPSHEKGHKYYHPIPRDRDQAFFKPDGTLLKLSSHKWGQPKFQGFDEEIRDVAGLEFNARYFDRTFLTELSWKDWEKIAKELQSRVTDEVIEKALKDLPPEIYALNGPAIAHKLEKRRDALPRYAKEYYLFLSRTVNIVGSKKAERFEVNRLNDEDTEVKVYRIKEKTGDTKFLAYHRVFKTHETEEIRLFGLGDDDRFQLSGQVKKGPLTRIIGGKGEDSINDQSTVAGLRRKNVLYDTKAKTSIVSAGELKNKTSDQQEGVNEYNRFEFKYDKLIPLVTGGFNPDDGLFIGAGFSLIKHKFRKEPFAVKHTFTAAVAPRSASFNFKYKGEFTQVFGKWDLLLEADVFEPSFADFFYGFGNKTTFDEEARDNDTQFYRARYGQWIFRPEIRRTLGDLHALKIGGFYRSVKIETDQNDQQPNRFIINYPTLIGRESDTSLPLLDERRHYIGGILTYSLDSRDAKSFPTRGLVWNLEGKAVWQQEDEQNEYQSLSSNLSFYFSFGGSLRTTVALRAGGQANFGEFEFYQAPRLGGFRTLRGYRRTRFAGDESFYQNTDVRIRLAEFRTPLFPGSFGLTLIHDVGRVWTQQEDELLTDPGKETWHRGMGGGLWIAPLGKTVISADYTVSNDDENAIFVRLGFLF